MVNQHFSILDNASHVNINGGTFQVGPSVTDAARDLLEQHVALNALPDSAAMYRGPKCYPETRLAINSKLQRWIRQHDDLDVKLMWLHGGAGAGKSAIMRTTALGGLSKQNLDNTSNSPRVLGSFFFFRNDPTRNTARTLIPTLALQLCEAHPAASDTILRTIAEKRSAIFSKPIWEQVRNLLVKPLTALSPWLSDTDQVQDESQPGRVFVIDGLDECIDRDSQVEIIEAIALLVQALPIRVLLASRLDERIPSTIRDSSILRDIYSEISLSDDPDSERDIRLFLEESLKQVYESRLAQRSGSLPHFWPTKRDISELVVKSSRHFIYASTAAKYIAAGDELPDIALRVILGLQAPRTGQPFEELDALYRFILGKARFQKEVLHIISFGLFTSLEVSVNSAHLVLGYSIDEIHHFLSDMRALITIDVNSRIYLLHKSFQDFLRDTGRARGLHIGTKRQFHRDHVENYFALVDLIATSSNNARNFAKSVIHGRPLIDSAKYRPPLLENHDNVAQDISQVIEDIAASIAASPLSDTVSALIKQHPPRHIHMLLEAHSANTRHRTSVSYMRAISQYDFENEHVFKDSLKDFLELYQGIACHGVKYDDDFSDIIIPLLLVGFDMDTLRDIYFDAADAEELSSIFSAFSFTILKKPICQHRYPVNLLRQIRTEMEDVDKALADATVKMLKRVTKEHVFRQPIPRFRNICGRRLAGNLLKALIFVLPQVVGHRDVAIHAMCALFTSSEFRTVRDAYSHQEMRRILESARMAMDVYWQTWVYSVMDGGSVDPVSGNFSIVSASGSSCHKQEEDPARYDKQCRLCNRDLEI